MSEPFVLYINSGFKPVPRERAQYARINYDDGHSLFAVLNQGKREKALTLKTIGQIVKRYNDGLESLVYETMNHRMDAVDMRRDMKALLRELAPEAIQEGWREGGLSEADIDDDDEEWAADGVSSWLDEQLQYVNDFARDTYDAGDDADKRKAILGRVDLWVDAMRRLAELAKAYAMKSQKAYWALGDRINHTPDCVALSRRKPRRLAKWIEDGYIPPIHFDCGCSLRLVSDDSVVAGE